MRNISLASYTITARKRNARDLEFTDSLYDDDLFDVFGAFLSERNAASNDAEEKMLLRIPIFKRSKRSFFGVVETGEYGYSGDLVNVESLKTSYSRKPNEALMLPFFFHIYLPTDEQEGLLVLQRFGNIGIRQVFANEFKKFFDVTCPNFSVRFSPIVHPGQLGTLAADGVVKRITFRQRQLPRDICDAYGGGNPEDAYVEYAIVAKRDSDLPMFKRVLRSLTDRNRNRLLIEDPPHFESSQVLVEIDLNGRRRTVDVSNTGKIRAYFDVTDRVKIGLDGFPTFRSMLRESRALVSDIWRSLRGPADAG